MNNKNKTVTMPLQEYLDLVASKDKAYEYITKIRNKLFTAFGVDEPFRSDDELLDKFTELVDTLLKNNKEQE